VTYRIEFTKSASKALVAIPRKDQKRIARKIENLAEIPPTPAKTKMKGSAHFIA
jgi:mRNA-degrading endonuclease RelE of RelBE toxin-antitoxin system